MTDRETGWRPTESLARALVVGGLCAVLAVGLGRPDLWVLGGPLLVAGVVALVRRPHLDARPGEPVVRLGNRFLHEGQGTVLHTRFVGSAMWSR